MFTKTKVVVDHSDSRKVRKKVFQAKGTGWARVLG